MDRAKSDAGRHEFLNPVGDFHLGDPFVLRWRGRFYLYGTNDGPSLGDGRVIPVYRSDDLIHWEPLGGALMPIDAGTDHWAPEVLAWNGRFYMAVSFGDVERKGHALWVAGSDRPEGPFRLLARLSAEEEAFSIDGSWLLDDDGRLYLYRCLDFVDESPPHGTGIVVQPMRDPLTPAGPPSTVLRAHSAWHLFERDRSMPLYGGRRFAEWTTIEGPAPVKRGGRYYCGYSGGNFAGYYGTGEAVAEHPLGIYRDLRGSEGPIFGTTPGLVEGPGHFSVVSPDLIHDWIVLHGRRPGTSGRRVWLCPARWGESGVVIGELTDRPQPRPALPGDLSRFDGHPGGPPVGWTTEGGDWRSDGDGLRQYADVAESIAWRDGLGLGSDWAVEVYVRRPSDAGCSGIVVRTAAGELRVESDGRALDVASDGRSISHPWPTLGDIPGDPSAYRPIVVRARDGRADIRADGVLIASNIALPPGPARLGLIARAGAAFGAVSATRQR